jgi:hypothetical protein
MYFRHKRKSNPPKPKPKELIRGQGQQVWQVANPRKQVSPKHFDGDVALIAAQVQFDSLRGARKIVHH